MNITTVEVLIIAACAAAAFGIGFFWRIIIDRSYLENRKKQASREADAIIREGKNEAQLAKKTALLEAKDEWFKAKTEFENESSKKKSELAHMQQQIKEQGLDLRSKEETLQKRENEFFARETFLSNKEKTLRTKEKELSRMVAIQNERLEKIANMSQEDAKKHLLENLENQVRFESAQIIKEIKDQAKNTAEAQAREIVVQAIQRSAADTTVESTVSVVHLPNDEMKGRIIGREGRNIRSFEEASGIDVIVDDTPEAVILSGFDPIRREVARMSLQELVNDGRIHPGRIEEVLKKSAKELEKKMKEEAETVIFELGVHGLHPKMVETLGRLRYRTSYGQNILQHSKEVAILCGIMASELGLDPKVAVRSGLLHDIGKAVDREVEGTHTALGAKLGQKYGEDEIIVNVIEGHHDDVPAISPYPILVQAADTISATRPGVRRDTMEGYVNRLSNLEDIADSFTGVNKSYVMQAGREIRVMVEPEQMGDAESEELASQIAAKIQDEMQYPGQIKVTAIRESRFTSYAR